MVKKNESRTYEEKLEKALVPDLEQPYKVPSNWVWTTVRILNKYEGSSVDPTKTPDETYELYSVPSSVYNYPEILSGIEIGSTKQIVKKDDVLLCKINPRINRVWKVYQHTNNPLVASTEWIVVRNSAINSDYLMWCFKSEFFRGFMLSNVSGVGGSLMRAQPKYVQTYPVPLPPLAEQQRIVELIEMLFSKLDEAKEKAQNALNSFESRKAAILHKAFTGELTQKWREENGINLELWEKETLKNICTKITDGTHKSPPNSINGEYMYVTAKNIKEHGVSLNDITYVSKKDFDEIFSRCNVEEGDVLYIKDGATTGIATVNQIHEPFAMLSSVALLKTNKDKILSKYLAYYLNSSKVKSKMISNMAGIAITRLTLVKIKESTVIVPPITEQTEIVRILDSIFEKEKQAKELAGVIEKIDLIKKAIIAKAFRGRLMTNIPEEESAKELLKEILKGD